MVVTTTIVPANYISSSSNNTTSPVPIQPETSYSNNTTSPVPIQVSSPILLQPETSSYNKKNLNNKYTKLYNNYSTTTNVINNDQIIKKDYTKSSGYKVGMVLFCFFGCAWLFFIIAIIVASFGLFKNKVLNKIGEYIGGFGALCILVSAWTSAFSIHHNRVKMNKDKYYNKDKYDKFIEAAWILPTTIYSIIAVFFLVIIIAAGGSRD